MSSLFLRAVRAEVRECAEASDVAAMLAEAGAGGVILESKPPAMSGKDGTVGVRSVVVFEDGIS